MNGELNEREQERLNTGRMMRAESELLLPLLETKKAAVIGKIIHYFKAGENDKLISCAAELSMIADMRNEITRKIKDAEMLEKRVHGEI